MIITISGTPGSGKSTVGKIIAERLKLNHYSTGDLMRAIAKDRGVSLEQLGKIADNDNGEIDRQLDDRQVSLGKNGDNFVIDGRLSFHFIPNSVKIFIDATIEERARRIYSDIVNNLRPSETAESLKDEISKISNRELVEKKRYQQYYQLNPFDKTNYDLVIDSTDLSINEVVEKILASVGRGNKQGFKLPKRLDDRLIQINLKFNEVSNEWKRYNDEIIPEDREYAKEIIVFLEDVIVFVLDNFKELNLSMYKDFLAFFHFDFFYGPDVDDRNYLNFDELVKGDSLPDFFIKLRDDDYILKEDDLKEIKGKLMELLKEFQ